MACGTSRRKSGAIMSVRITGTCEARKRGNRSIGLDNAIKVFADQILQLQANKHVNSRELAAELNRLGIPSPSGGSWTHSRLFRMLARGTALGIEFKRRGRSDAASRRKVHRRSKDVIEAERRAGFRKLAMMLAGSTAPSDTGTTAMILLKRAQAHD